MSIETLPVSSQRENEPSTYIEDIDKARFMADAEVENRDDSLRYKKVAKAALDIAMNNGNQPVTSHDLRKGQYGLDTVRTQPLSMAIEHTMERTEGASGIDIARTARDQAILELESAKLAAERAEKSYDEAQQVRQEIENIK